MYVESDHPCFKVADFSHACYDNEVPHDLQSTSPEVRT
jgi:hypothetical protein